MEDIQLQFLTPQSVSIITQPNNHMKAYINSEIGRIELLSEVNNADIIEQVMLLWGDNPLIFPEILPELNDNQMSEKDIWDLIASAIEMGVNSISE